MNFRPQTTKPREVISRVKNIVTGDEYFTSNLYEKNIDGIPFVGVFVKPDSERDRRISWMKKDQLVKMRKG
jgi:hypothetical protein|tara:strand:- start:59 stop:271 length:213 start_codon:yes stop_codon:yes gene_type:complete